MQVGVHPRIVVRPPLQQDALAFFFAEGDSARRYVLFSATDLSEGTLLFVHELPKPPCPESEAHQSHPVCSYATIVAVVRKFVNAISKVLSSLEYPLCFDLDLPDPLMRNTQLFTELCERSRFTVVQPVSAH